MSGKGPSAETGPEPAYEVRGSSQRDRVQRGNPERDDHAGDIQKDEAHESGQDSPHLDDQERKQAKERAAIGPLVIHEIVREQGLTELDRSFSGLAWSGLAAGLSVGFSFLSEASIAASLPDAPWSHVVASFGYSIGFLIVILGQQQLFTETTLTAVIPTLTGRDPAMVARTARVWAVVLVANILPTWAWGWFAARSGVFAAPTLAAMQHLGIATMSHGFWQTTALAGLAGWLIGLMVWLLPASGPAKPFLIVILTTMVALFNTPHIIAGSAEAACAVASGDASVLDYLTRFFAPTLLGNVIGGTVLAALLNHAQIRDELTTSR